MKFFVFLFTLLLVLIMVGTFNDTPKTENIVSYDPVKSIFYGPIPIGSDENFFRETGITRYASKI